MDKANHLKPIHTGGTTCITTRREPARELAANLDLTWPQDWRNDGREPGANWPHTRIFSWPLALIEASFGLSSAHANGGGVAFFAHVGGFVFGLLAARLLTRTGQVTPQERERSQ